MPNILFASNNKSHWPQSVVSTTAGTFDSTRVPYSFILENQNTIASPEFAPAAGTVTWFHYRFYAPSGINNSTQTYMIRIFDASQNLLAEVKKHESSYFYDLGVVLYDGGSSVTDMADFPINVGVENSIDVKYTVTAGTSEIKLYINGGLAAVQNYATNGSGFTNPVQFTLSTPFANTASGAIQNHYSEIIVADADTRNARMSLLQPVAAGGETDWVGVITELADGDPTSGMTALIAAQRETVTLGAYTGASNISSMVVATQSVAGAGGPQNIRHTVRMSTVNYDSVADIPISNVLQYDITDFKINPATSLPWVAGDLATLEIGFVSKT